ncbi:hypothetical protein EG329_012706 [Mollisiaceae sp. DMI_Dod_QoI]|nr:hypothetical protein EG329_012706 [Helotiales sp. DMI_Dod_QoI]
MSSHAGRIVKKRTTTRTSANDIPDPKPRPSLGTVVARKSAPTASRPLKRPAQEVEREEDDEEESTSSVAQIAPTAAKEYLYQVGEDTQKLWGPRQNRKLGLYRTVMEANARVIERWEEVYEVFRGSARGGEEDDGRLWWEANGAKNHLGRMWVRIEQLEVEKMEGSGKWGWMRPVYHADHWSQDGIKSMRDEELENKESTQGGFLRGMEKKVRGNEDKSERRTLSWLTGRPGGAY